MPINVLTSIVACPLNVFELFINLQILSKIEENSKICDHPCTPPNCYNFFFSPSIITSGKNVNFGDKKIKSDFYKNKKITKIDDIEMLILVSKEEPYGTKIHLNTLLDTMIIMLLEHYA